MNTIPQILVGVDVSKKTLDIYLHPVGESLSFENSKEGLKKLHEVLLPYEIKSIMCEASGGYEGRLVTFFTELQYTVNLVTPKRIKSFKEAEGVKAKTDRIDAKIIALFAVNRALTKQHVLSGDEGQLESLSRRRSQLIKMITEEKNRLDHPQNSENAELIKDTIDFLEKQLTQVQENIDALIKANPIWHKKSLLLQTMPGVGENTASLLIAELPELGQVDKRQIVALCGLAPYTKQSGQYNGEARISGGRKIVRNALYMCALSAIKYNPVLKEFYQKLRKKGKKAKVALVAVMRRMIIILNSMLTKEEGWIDKNKTIS